MFHWIISQDLFLIALSVVFSRTWTLHAGVLKMPRASHGLDYDVLEVKCKRDDPETSSY